MATPMELFLLTLVSQGVDTLYALQTEAHLSSGAICPVLSRLEKNGLIEKAADGGRQKRVMRISDQGRQVLKSVFTSSLADTTSWDLDSAVRVVWSALQFSPEAGIRLIEHVARQRSERATFFHADAVDFRARMETPMSTYGWMRAVTKSQQLRAEAEAIRQIGAQIKTDPG